MAVPNMRRTLRGWIKPVAVKTIIQTVVDHKTVNTPTDTTLKMNKQPMPASKVNRKPEYQRAWTWWSFVVQDGPLLKKDDIIVIAGTNYRIESSNDWSESGFQKYEAVEGYQ